MTIEQAGHRYNDVIAPEEPGRWLDVYLVPNVMPIDAKARLASGKSIPDGLEVILFDPITTDAILDAAVCPLLPEILETSDIRHKCLFTGQAMQDISGTAPWLVELKPDHAFTRKLMGTKDTPGGLWELELGIILKSALGFDEIWSHCRKFTRIQDEAGKWLYYRYWSAPVSTRVMALGNRPELIQFVSPFFPPVERGIDVLLLNSDMHALLRRVPGTQPPVPRPVLTTAAHNTIRQVRRVQQYEHLIDLTLKHVAGKTDLTERDIRDTLRRKRDGFFASGFWQRDHLAKLMVWEVLLGPEFIQTYAQGTVKAIIASATAPYAAIMNIEYFLEAQEIRRIREEDALKDQGRYASETEIWT